MNYRSILVFALCAFVACSNDGDKDNKDDDGEDFTSDGSAPGREGDLLAPSPALDVPGVAPALADSLLQSTTFAAAYDATLSILAEGGVSVRFRTDVEGEGKAPQSTTHVFPTFAANLALEGSDRETMATYTLADFAAMMDNLGWPLPGSVTAADAWVTLFAEWYAEASANPDAPDSFAILFIAAMNQKQEPPANIATGTDDPSRIRLSLLEVELLVAAFDRVTATSPLVPLSTRSLRQSSSPCSDFVEQSGVLGDIGQFIAGQLTGTVIGKALEAYYGSELGDQMSTALSTAGTVAKIAKLIQQFRYGYIKLELTSADPVKKPLSNQPNKHGELRAVAGVDQQKYDDAVAHGGGGSSPQHQAIADCMSSLGLPTTTDARDIAADASNWRVAWQITNGGGSQVTWGEGNTWDINNGQQKVVTRVDDTTVESKVAFDILPQKSRATVGKERKRVATFKVTLRRGAAPDIGTLWGAGGAGAAAAAANPLGAALGLGDAIVDIVSGWALEGASPSAFVSQELIEIEPTGLIGTVSWTINGAARRRYSPGGATIAEDVLVAQSGTLDIVSSDLASGDTTAFGSEQCRARYNYTWETLDAPEGSEIVGTRIDRKARRYSDTWVTSQQTPPAEAASIFDDTENADVGFDYPYKGKVLVSMYPDVFCGGNETLQEVGELDYEYYDGEWHTEVESYVAERILLMPILLHDTVLELDRPNGTDHVKGEKEHVEVYEIEGMDVTVTHKVKWNLYWAK